MFQLPKHPSQEQSPQAPAGPNRQEMEYNQSVSRRFAEQLLRHDYAEREMILPTQPEVRKHHVLQKLFIELSRDGDETRPAPRTSLEAAERAMSVAIRSRSFDVDDLRIIASHVYSDQARLDFIKQKVHGTMLVENMPGGEHGAAPRSPATTWAEARRQLIGAALRTDLSTDDLLLFMGSLSGSAPRQRWEDTQRFNLHLTPAPGRNSTFPSLSDPKSEGSGSAFQLCVQMPPAK